MKKFLLKTIGFMIVAAMIPAVILLWPISKKYQYNFVKNACTLKSNYIYHRIYEDTLGVDIAFLGSSHTMCGINDSIFKKVLDDGGIHLHVSNMGFCRLGRDMDYLIFKDLLKYKKPKIVVLEVRQEEPELGHPDFGYMADLGDILDPPIIVNRSFFSDLSNALTVRLNYIRDMLSHKEYNIPYEAPNMAFAQKNIIADTSVLYSGARTRWEHYYKYPRPEWGDRIMTRYPKLYLAKIMSLAIENHVKVVMLYIPNFGYPNHTPKELKYYKAMGDVILMPNRFYDNERNWMEDEHINSSAAAILSDSVAHYVISHSH